MDNKNVSLCFLRDRRKRMLLTAVAPVCILMNLGGSALGYLKLPIYLDSIGTVLSAVFLGIPASIFVGTASALLAGFMVSPIAPYYIGTSAAFSFFVGLMAKKGFFQSIPKVLLTGLALGFISAIVSAPVSALLFSGMSGYSSDLITAYFLIIGNSIIQSVFFSYSIMEPLDKISQCLLVFWIINRLPRNVTAQFSNIGYLDRNLKIRI